MRLFDKRRAIFVIIGVSIEFFVLVYAVGILHKSLSEFSFVIFASLVYWLIVLFSKNLSRTLVILTLFLLPFNRFLILYSESAYLLGRVSDYLVVGLHLFEIPLYTWVGYMLMKGGRKVVETLLKRCSHVPPQSIRVTSVEGRADEALGKLLLPFVFSVLIFFAIVFGISKGVLLVGISRIQILVDGGILYLMLVSFRGAGNVGVQNFEPVLIASGIFQSLISVAQVVLNHSVGLYALGESQFNEGLFYIAKSYLFDSLRVRAYGTFPHPNVLAAFLFIVVVLQIHDLLDVIQKNVLRSWSNCLHRGVILRLALLSINLMGLYLTQSRTAIFALIIAITLSSMLYILANIQSYVKYVILFITVFAIGAGTFFCFQERIMSIFTYDSSTIGDRVQLQSFAVDCIKESPFVGLGPNGYVKHLAENSGVVTRRSFLVEPVHNVPLLIWAELGFLAVVSFVVFLCFRILQALRPCLPRLRSAQAAQVLRHCSAQAIRRERGRERIFLVLAFVIYLVLALNLDHFMFTLKQGMGIMVMFLVLL